MSDCRSKISRTGSRFHQQIAGLRGQLSGGKAHLRLDVGRKSIFVNVTRHAHDFHRCLPAAGKQVLPDWTWAPRVRGPEKARELFINNGNPRLAFAVLIRKRPPCSEGDSHRAKVFRRGALNVHNRALRPHDDAQSNLRQTRAPCEPRPNAVRRPDALPAKAPCSRRKSARSTREKGKEGRHPKARPVMTETAAVNARTVLSIRIRSARGRSAGPKRSMVETMTWASRTPRAAADQG